MKSPHESRSFVAGADESPLAIKSAEGIIFRWESKTSEEGREKLIFQSDRDEVDQYLRAVDEIQRSMSLVSSPSFSGEVKIKSAIQIAMARLEDEFRNILTLHTSTPGTDSLFIDLSTSSSSHTVLGEEVTTPTSFNSSNGEDFSNLLDCSDSNSGFGSDFGSDSSRLPSGRSSYRSTSSIREIELIPSEAVADLRSIAQRMIAAGYLRECIQVYGTVRKSAVDAVFRQLGIEKLSIGDVQRLAWEALEGKIRRWIRGAKVCIRVIFPSEKRLCEQVFEGIETAIDDACFMEAVKGPALQLFNFAEAISISKRSPEKLFKILDLHDALADLLPDIDEVFGSKSSESIKVQAAEIVSRLAEAVTGILSEFENAVLREPSVVPVPGGTLHPLTRYVMNYISLISDYRHTLVELIKSEPPYGSVTSDIDFTELKEKRPLSQHLIWIIVILQINLEGKSKHYKDSSLSHLFLMNNVHYIVRKIKGSPELREIICDDYLRLLMGKFRQASTYYQRATWVRVLHCLRDEGLHVSGSFSSGVSKSALRERFKAFNAAFEEVHKTQSAWMVPDPQLREELRISITEKLIPAYRSFLGRFGSHIESGRHPENYIKYSVEDLEMAVLDFFEGHSVSSSHIIRKRSH